MLQNITITINSVNLERQKFLSEYYFFISLLCLILNFYYYILNINIINRLEKLYFNCKFCDMFLISFMGFVYLPSEDIYYYKDSFTLLLFIGYVLILFHLKRTNQTEIIIEKRRLQENLLV